MPARIQHTLGAAGSQERGGHEALRRLIGDREAAEFSPVFEVENVLADRTMTKYIVTLTASPLDKGVLSRAAGISGWGVLMPRNPGFLRSINSARIAALLFDRETIGGSWSGAASALRRIAPEAQLIACCRFSETPDSAELSEAGIFHAVTLPLSESELRQSLGFVWAAERQRALPARRQESGLTTSAAA